MFIVRGDLPHWYSQGADHLIDSAGWVAVHMMPTPGDAEASVFSYTVGLTTKDHPELMIVGLGPDKSHEVLLDLAGRVYDQGARFTDGQRVPGVLDGRDVAVRTAAPTHRIRPAVAYERYGQGAVRAQQVLWPDWDGFLPGEDGYQHGPWTQPLLTPPVETPPPPVGAGPLLPPLPPFTPQKKSWWRFW